MLDAEAGLHPSQPVIYVATMHSGATLAFLVGERLAREAREERLLGVLFPCRPALAVFIYLTMEWLQVTIFQAR